ncbi:hypothetical protein D3C81_1455450 [compost metagenome]
MIRCGTAASPNQTGSQIREGDGALSEVFRSCPVNIFAVHVISKTRIRIDGKRNIKRSIQLSYYTHDPFRPGMTVEAENIGSFLAKNREGVHNGIAINRSADIIYCKLADHRQVTVLPDNFLCNPHFIQIKKRLKKNPIDLFSQESRYLLFVVTS